MTCGAFSELPRLDSNQDKESQKVFLPRHKLLAEKTFDTQPIPFDAGLRESPDNTTFDAELRGLLDAWPPRPAGPPSTAPAAAGSSWGGLRTAPATARPHRPP